MNYRCQAVLKSTNFPTTDEALEMIFDVEGEGETEAEKCVHAFEKANEFLLISTKTLEADDYTILSFEFQAEDE